MPQTRFVLKKALEHGLKPIVVVNKIDRPGARPHEVIDEVFDLMVELGANDEQLDFPIVYTSAVERLRAPRARRRQRRTCCRCSTRSSTTSPRPTCDADGPVAMQVCTIDYSNFVGRIGIGRIFSGTHALGERILVIKNDGSRYQATVKQLYTFEGMGRQEAESAHAGDICAVVGVEDADIGDMFTCRIDPVHARPDPRRGADDVGRVRAVHEPARGPGGRHRRRPPDQGAPAPRGRVQHLDAHHRDRGQDRHGGRRPRRAAPLGAHGDDASRGLRVPGRAARRSSSRRTSAARSSSRSSRRSSTCRASTPARSSRSSAARGGEMTDMVQRDEHVHLEFKIPYARRHGPAHPHPQRDPRRGDALPPLRRVRRRIEATSAGGRTAR